MVFVTKMQGGKRMKKMKKMKKVLALALALVFVLSNVTVYASEVDETAAGDQFEDMAGISVNEDTAQIYEIIDLDGTLADISGTITGGSYFSGTRVRIKPIAPVVGEGYTTTFIQWENLPSEGVTYLDDNCIEITVKKGFDAYDISAKYEVEDQRSGFFLNNGEIYEKINSDGSKGEVEEPTGGYFVAGTVLKIKPVAPKVLNGYVAVFKAWKNLPESGVKILEDNKLEITITEDMIEKYYYPSAEYIVNKENDDSKTEYCNITFADGWGEDYDSWAKPVIKSVDGKKVDNLTQGVFKAGTVLGLERERGMFWYQGAPGEYALGRFSDAKALKTTYIVPNQSEVNIYVWGGGNGGTPNLCVIRAVDAKITALGDKQLSKPITETKSGEPVLVTVTADEKESTDEYDYIFKGWESESGNVEFTNPTEKTTQFMSEVEIGSVVFAIYEAVPKNPELSGEVSVDIESPVKGLKVDGLNDAVLTESDKAALAAGKNVDISMKVEEKELSSISQSDLKLMQNVLTEGMKLGTVLDITIEKQIEGETVQQVTELNKPIKITVDVPKTLLSDKKDIKRTFSVIRLHEGVAKVLSDIDKKDETITFETNQFSLYGIAYKDEAVKQQSTSDNGNPTENGVPKTGDSAQAMTFTLLCMMAGAVTVVCMKRKNIMFKKVT